MKSIITNLFMLFFVFGAVNNTFSQTEAQRRVITKNYDQVALKKLAQRLGAEYTTNYNRALILAKENNWPIRIQKADGGVSELVGVTDKGAPRYYTTTNEGSAITSRTNLVQGETGLGLNLKGIDMVAGVWDESKPFLHDDYKGRLFNFDQSNNFTEVSFHSTHVTGTIISNGDHSAEGKGMASEADVWNSNWINDLDEMAQAAATGMLLSNHSYGSVAQSLQISEFGAYMKSAKDLDEIMYDAPKYQVVFAAGNDRDENPPVNPTKQGYDLLTDNNTAKNVIVVAAVNQVLNYTGPQSVVMSTFSNWGPTDDNRIKPDISTKGVQVYSTDTNPDKIGYDYLSGTSMAAPGITGSLLLLQQHFGNLYGDYMLSSTLRALMIHTASEAGSYAGPDPKFGWGLMNTAAAAQIITNSITGSDQYVIAELALSKNITTYTKQITITGNEPLVATIDWTDPPGTATNGVLDSKVPVLVNDLDIRITKDNETYLPWKLGPGYTDPAQKGDNNVDNVEKIEILNPEAGTYTITVSYKGDLAIINDKQEQEFSLIITGGTTLSTNDTVFRTFNVWPNPINDQLNVAIQSQLNDDVFVTIYDIQGKRIVNKKLDFSNEFFNGSINVETLNPGVYLVKVMQGNKQSVRKIIKK